MERILKVAIIQALIVFYFTRSATTVLTAAASLIGTDFVLGALGM